MAIITTPGAGVSPYEPTTAAPTVLRAGADGSTVSTSAAAAAATVSELAAANANTLVVVSGQAALNSLITSSQPGVFEGANVTINLEEQNFNTTNQVTATTNYPSGNTGEIQYNSGANSFASDPYFTYANSNVVTPGIRTNNYLYANGAPFLAGGNAAIGNFVFTGDNMTIAHANSTLNINGNGTGNVNVTANSNTWIFGSTGILTFPGNSRVAPVGANIELQAAAGGYAEIVTSDGNNYVAVTGSDAQIVTSGINTWTFDNVGNLILPGNTFAVKYANGDTVAISTGGFPLANGTSNIDIATANGNVTVTSSGNTWTFNTDGNLSLPTAGNIVGAVNIIGNGTGNVNVEANGRAWTFAADGNLVLPLAGNIVNYGNTWNFGYDGNLTLPANIIAINYANGNRVTGNITFRDEIVIGTGTSNLISGLYLAPSSSSADANMYLRVRGNIVDEPTHIHFDTGNNAYYNQFIGDDNKYIQLANTGNIVINSNDVAGNAAQWTFGTDGNLTFPTGNLVITPDDPAGNIASIASTDHPLGILSTGANGAVSSLWIEDYANVGTSNIAAVYANPTPGSKIVRIAVGQNGSPGPNLWDFDAAGNLTLPNGAVIKDTVGNAVAFGRDAAGTGPQGNAAVAIGQQAGETSQGASSVAIGYQAGLNTQGINAVAIGNSAGNNNQGGGTVAIGYHSGEIQQGTGAVAVGADAGANVQGDYTVAVGLQAGNSLQGDYAVAVGFNAGYDTQGVNSVAIGSYAGQSAQGNNSIIINATGAGLNALTANTFTVAPVRNDVANIAEVVFYNTTSKEITYGNTISVTGNITGGNVLTGGLISASGNATANNGMFTNIVNVASHTGAVVSVSGNVTGGNLITAGQIISTQTGNSANGAAQIYLNGSGNNRIEFNASGLAVPNDTTRSAGTKILLYPGQDGTGVDYAIGMESTAMWFSIHDTTRQFNWYANTTAVASLSGTGNLSATGNITGGNVLTVGTVKTGSFVTGTIPAAVGAGAGARAFVTDADSVTFGNLYVGGSGNAMPVWSNGTNWYIG